MCAQEVLQLLRKHKLYAKLSKCSFSQPAVDFLGHTVSAHWQGISMDAHKVKAVLDWPQPAVVKKLRSFLGLAAYYMKFVSHHAAITAPLTDLLHHDAAWVWDTTHQQEFSALKSAVSAARVLTIPDPNGEFTVATDASDYAIGAVLEQNSVLPSEWQDRCLQVAQAEAPRAALANA